MGINKYDKALSPDGVILDLYLLQYRSCLAEKHDLERREKEIAMELESPLHGISYDGMPRGSSQSVGCAAISFRLDEIRTRIKEQKNEAARILSEIMEVIAYLPPGSMPRRVIEHRYIDRQNWNRICKDMHISMTPAKRYWKKGLYDLLEFKKIQQIVDRYRQHLLDEDPGVPFRT